MRLHLLLTALLAGPVSSSAAETPAKPNVLVLFSDDQSYETIRAFGHLDIDTPNLDRLAARGTTFTHAYNMGSWSAAVCIASRNMLMTGRSVWQAQPLHGALDKEREAGRLWPLRMKAAGYTTYFTGKWHLPVKAEACFDVTRNVRPGMPRDTAAAYNRPLAGQPDAWSPSDPAQGGFWTGGKHWTEVAADDAVDFLGQAARGKAPFFMYVAFNAPHDPRQSPQSFVDLYPPSRVTMPDNFLPEYPHKEAIGCGPDLRDEKLAPFPRTEHAVKVHRGEYFALITHLDQQIGRILDALEESGQDRNTLVLFSSDHGLAVGHHGLFGKQNLYDHSMRVPFLVAGPGIPAGRKLGAPVYLQDLMATALDAAGASNPAEVYFQSVLPLARGEPGAKPREEIYGAYLGLQRALVHDGYKLIAYPAAGKLRLYHLSSDPGERTDLAGDPAHRETVARMLERLRAKQRELGDSLDLSGLRNGR